MKKIAFVLLTLCLLAGCGIQQVGKISQEEQLRVMQEVAASRHASTTAFQTYVAVCMKQFPSATNARDDGGMRLDIEGFVNVALTDGGYEIVCSVSVTTLNIERMWVDERTYTLHDYMASEEARKLKSALAAKDAVQISSGNHDAFLKEAKQSITRNFKDPDSALFRDVYLSNRAVPTLCGEVNAKNSYGGYVGYRAFFYNRLVSYIDDPDGQRSQGFTRSKPVYCGDKFLDLPR